jgi:hypothetical protein
MRFAYGLILIALLTLSAASALAQNLVDGETLHALEAAQKAVHAEPDSETNRLDLASRYLKAGWNRSAVDTLKVYLQVHPDAPSTLRLISVAYLREDDYAARRTPPNVLYASVRAIPPAFKYWPWRNWVWERQIPLRLFSERLCSWIPAP